MGIKYLFKMKIYKMYGLKLNKYELFHPLEAVGRDSDTQLQVGENLFCYRSASKVNHGGKQTVGCGASSETSWYGGTSGNA